MAPITTLLVANRGEIARRVMRTARAMGITTVAVFSDPDEQAPFVAEADEAVRLPGSTPAETYLDVDRVIAAARAAGADAIHPGYGFLSENAAFARACTDAGIVFVGPSPEAIEAMGSKLAAKALMTQAGVPVLPGATVGAGTDALEAAAGVGYPLLVKAAFGGGGRGMRVVRGADELSEAVASAEREAAAAFGDGTVFLERFVEAPRHIEVQIFGDSFGNVVHLFERECSIQRRYQKIVEEAPSPAVDAALRSELGSAAVAAAKTLGYVGAGTVEFVVDRTGAFYFLEVNTRLQVEHPVTELVTGLDLVELQLLVAQGERLPPEVLRATLDGHAIEARLYAEDVAAGFLPVSGTLDRMRIEGAADGSVGGTGGGPRLRVDSGYEDGSTVSTFYDAMVAKVITWAPTRAEAATRLADALARAEIHGLRTNRDLLVGILRHPEFVAGETDTAFLSRHDPAELGAAHVAPAARHLHPVAAALAGQARRRADAVVQGTLPSGWRNVVTAPQLTDFDDGQSTVTIGYAFRRGRLALSVDGERLDGVELWSATPERVDLSVGGVRRRYDVHQVGAVAYVDSPLGATTLTEIERFPLPGAAAVAGSLLAPMPGSVARVLAELGLEVALGDPLIVLEAMKMEHTLVAPHDGVVAEIRVDVGQQVDTGAVLVVVDDAVSPD